MGKKFEITDTEKQLFRQAVRGIKPLINTKVQKPQPVTPARRVSPETEENFSFSDHENLPPLGPEDKLEFKREGIQHKILRNLKQGQYNVQAHFDMHGMTVEEAKRALAEFLLQCQKNGVRYGLIIHGKGRSSDKPILKNKLNHWLRQAETVLAFCSASIKHGHRGAVYVLLKRNKV